MDEDPGHILEIIRLSDTLAEAADKLGSTVEYLQDYQDRFQEGESAVDVEAFPLASGEAMPTTVLANWLQAPIPKSWLQRMRWPGGAKSPSWFYLIANCARKHAKRYRHKIPDPSGLDALVGNGCHGALRNAAMIRLHKRRGAPSTAGKEELLFHLETQSEVVHDRGTEVLKRCREIFETMDEPVELGNVWGAEFLWSFHASPGLLVAGIADLILVYPDPRNPNGPPELVVVVDYKTGPGHVPSQEELRADPQACLELLWAKRFFHNAKRVQFKLWNILQNQKVTIDWDYSIEQNTLAFARAAFHVWSQKIETPNVTRACKWCPYRSDCKGYNKSLQAENYLPKESLENLEIDALIAEGYRAKVIADLADTRRLDIAKLILQKLGPGQKNFRSAHLLAIRKSRKTESFASVSRTVFRLAEAAGVDLGSILDACTSLGDGRKIKTWIQTLTPKKQEFAKVILEADKQTRSSPPWVEIRESKALF